MSGLLHLAKSLFEISEIDQPEENASRTGGIEKMLQVIQKDVTIAKQENEEDSDDDDSTDENFVGDTIQKFVDIFNERSSVYVIGAPGSGKTTFIEEMTTLVGCNSVTKPNMVSSVSPLHYKLFSNVSFFYMYTMMQRCNVAFVK